MVSFYTSIARYGKTLLYRGYRNGYRVEKKVVYGPRLFVPSKDGTHTSIFGQPLEQMRFETMREAKDFINNFSASNFQIYGTTDYVAQYIQDRWPDKIDHDLSLINKVFIDIEVYSEDGFPEPEEARHEVDAITVKSSKNKKYYVWGLKEYDPRRTELDIPPENIEYVWCEDEIDLLSKFLTWWISEEFNPDVVTGWNIRTFDIPYLVNRITKLMGDDKARLLSPWKKVQERRVTFKGRDMQMYELTGISQLDYLDTFQKFGYKYGPQESYRLDHIAHVVLGEKKLSYDEYGSLQNLSSTNYQKYIDYNIKDTQLVERIDEVTKLLDLVMSMSYKAGVNFTDAFGTTRIWDTIIYRYLMRDDIVVQPTKEHFSATYPGGYVKDPHVGLSKYVVSFDLNSLYPNIIVQYNMSPETLLNERVALDVDKCMGKLVPESEHAVAANGSMYKKDKQGVIPRIIEEYYSDRKTIQAQLKQVKIDEQNADGLEKSRLTYLANRMHNEQMSIKILMNSLYGALGNQYFRHYDLRVAEGITLSGQLTIKWAERAINMFLNKALKTEDKDYVIAIDTDSVYVNMEPVVNFMKPDDPIAFLGKFADEVVEPVLDKAFAELFEQQNAYKQRMVMGREVIARSGVWTAKKRYALSVEDDEGLRLKEPKLKIMGIEAIKSSTPAVCRGWMKDTIKIILEGDKNKAQNFVANLRTKFHSLPPEDIAAPRGVSKIKSYMLRDGSYIKGTPINSKAAITYNRAIQHAGLDKKYQMIQEGDKMKYIHLKLPNPTREKVIGFPDVFPRELKLEHYIDYNTQFEKVYEDAIAPIMNAVGWQVEEQNTLEGFFS